MSNKLYTCDKPDCFACYELNRVEIANNSKNRRKFFKKIDNRVYRANKKIISLNHLKSA